MGLYIWDIYAMFKQSFPLTITIIAVRLTFLFFKYPMPNFPLLVYFYYVERNYLFDKILGALYMLD